MRREEGRIKERESKINSEERNYDDKLNTNFHVMFSRKNISYLNDLEKPFIHDNILKETPKMGSSSPMKNEAIAQAFVFGNYNKKKMKRKKEKENEDDFSFGFQNEKKPSVTAYNSKLMKYFIRNKKKKKIKLVLISLFRFYRQSAHLSTSSKSKSIEKYQSYEHKRKVSNDNKKKLIKKMIRNQLKQDKGNLFYSILNRNWEK